MMNTDIDESVEQITIPVFPTDLHSGYDHSHRNLEFINDEDIKIAIMYYKLNDEPDVLVYSHGNGSDIGDSNEYLSKLAYSIGINIITYDYLGYGLSSDTKIGDNATKPSEQGCMRAIDAVFKYLLSKGSEPKHIILYGASLGSGPTVELASRIPDLKGIILQTPFVNFGSFRSDLAIKNVMCSVTIIHGKKDKIIPYSHAVHLYNILLKRDKNKKVKFLTIDDISHTHNNIYCYEEIIVPAIIEIIDPKIDSADLVDSMDPKIPKFVEHTCIQCYKKFIRENSVLQSNFAAITRCDQCYRCPCGSYFSSQY